ncbi:MAG: Gfo/Idh/MocA family oxidoreductase [Thermoanaerobaculia bacterium]
MRALVVGCGSIGRRHTANLRTLGVERIATYDAVAEQGRAAAAQFHTEYVESLDAALENGGFDLTLVCTPPSTHLEISRRAVASGSNVFVEKPLSNDLAGVDALISEARLAERFVAVGYNLRFHAGIRRLKEVVESGEIGVPLIIRAEVGQYLPDWRAGSDYRSGYNASAAMGGGIILDASHELDYVRWLGGEVTAVSCVAAHLTTLDIDVEDAAAITMRLASGAIAEVHLDSIQRVYARNCKLIGEEGTARWEFGEDVRLFSASSAHWKTLPATADPNDMYLDEMKHVLQCAAGESVPLVGAEEGRRVLEIVLAAKESSRSAQEVVL